MGKKKMFLDSIKDLFNLYEIHTCRVRNVPGSTDRLLDKVIIDSKGERIELSVETILDYCGYENPYKKEDNNKNNNGQP